MLRPYKNMQIRLIKRRWGSANTWMFVPVSEKPGCRVFSRERPIRECKSHSDQFSGIKSVSGISYRFPASLVTIRVSPSKQIASH